MEPVKNFSFFATDYNFFDNIPYPIMSITQTSNYGSSPLSMLDR
jgi:hypothetical protein